MPATDRFRLGFAAALWLAAGLSLAGWHASAAEPEPARTPELRRGGTPAISPDQRWIAFAGQVPMRPEDLGGKVLAWNLADGTPHEHRGAGVFLMPIGNGADQAEPLRIGTAYAWAPTWSPDGRTLAYYSNEGGLPQLWFFDPATKSRRRGSERKIFAQLGNLEGAVWSSDGSRVYVPVATSATLSVQRKSPYNYDQAARLYAFENNDPQVATAAIAEIAVADEAVTLLPSVGPLNFLRQRSLSPSGQKLLVLTPDYRLGVIDLVNRKMLGTVEIDPLVTDSKVSYTDLFAGAIWSPTADSLAFLSDGGLCLLDCASGTLPVRRALASNLTGLRWGRNNPFAFSRDGRLLVGVVFVGDDLDLLVAPTDGSAARVFPLLQGTAARNLEYHAKLEGPFGIGLLQSAAGRLWQPEASVAFAEFPDTLTAENVIVKFNLLNGERSEFKRWHGRLTLLTSAPDAQIIAAYEDFRTRDSFYRLSPALEPGSSLLPVAPIEPEIRDARVDTFSMKVPDLLGVFRTVATTIVRPAAARGEIRGTVVSVYPGAKESGRANFFAGRDVSGLPAASLLQHGYAIAFSDSLPFPSALSSDGEIVRSQAVIDPLLPQLYRASQLGYLDLEKLVVVGHSQGGLAALQAVAHSGLFRGAVGLSGVRYALNKAVVQFPVTDGYTDSADFMAGIAAMVDGAPALHARDIRVPVLLIHGEADQFKIRASEMMAEALRRAGGKVQLVRYPGEGHDYSAWTEADRRDMTSRVIRFLDECTGTSAR